MDVKFNEIERTHPFLKDYDDLLSLESRASAAQHLRDRLQ